MNNIDNFELEINKETGQKENFFVENNIFLRSLDPENTKISRHVEGYALLFNTESQVMYEDGKFFIETINRNALNGVLEKSDVLARLNHNDNAVLARYTRGEGNLKLEIDEKGLKYSFESPNTNAGNDLVELLKTNVIRNSSFGAVVFGNGMKITKKDGIFYRHITQISNVFDISPVYTPAYKATNSTLIRSFEKIINEEEQEIILRDEKNKAIKEYYQNLKKQYSFIKK